jgi:hypothetical protein
VDGRRIKAGGRLIYEHYEKAISTTNNRGAKDGTKFYPLRKYDYRRRRIRMG